MFEINGIINFLLIKLYRNNIYEKSIIKKLSLNSFLGNIIYF